MGKLDATLQLPRKDAPVAVKAGSVGIAGLQTGIYPVDSPGGWHIIGRTPLQLFDPNPVKLSLFHAGDRIRFKAISADEYTNYQAGHS
jgi:inhibitor of KinA